MFYPELPTPIDKEILEDVVIDEFPYPIASCYRRMVEQRSGAGQMGCFIDTTEALLSFLATIVLSHYWRTGAFDKQLNRRLLDIFIKGKFGVGVYLEIVREVTRVYIHRWNEFVYPELIGFLFTSSKKLTSRYEQLEQLVIIRNKNWGHKGGGRDDHSLREAYEKYLPLLDEVLSQLGWIRRMDLVVPVKINQDGQVTRVHIFMSERIRRNRPYTIQLQAEDYDTELGDVRPERSLLLVNRETGEYLPLYPLAFCDLPEEGWAVYFLQDIKLRQRQRNLRKTTYATYGRSGSHTGRREFLSGEGPTPRLEERLRHFFHQLTASETFALLRKAPEQPPWEMYDLPGVRAEQAYHLKTFIGREKFLKELSNC